MRNSLVALAAVFLGGCAPERGEPFAYDEFIEHADLRSAAVKTVNAYIGENTDKEGAFVAKVGSGSERRRFRVVSVFDVLSRKGDVYTIQVDVDELDKAPRHLLFFDLEKADNGFVVTGIRYGGRHLRQTMG